MQFVAKYPKAAIESHILVILLDYGYGLTTDMDLIVYSVSVVLSCLSFGH